MNAQLKQNGDAPLSADSESFGVKVSLEQIKSFVLNPRRSRNPRYEKLKASIRQRGLDNPPLLTRHPDEELYTIASGGNTRLAILNELWQETGEERFHTLVFPFRPWPELHEEDDALPSADIQGELQCLIGHLAESDLHSQLTFIERAEAIMQIRDIWLQSQHVLLSQRQLARLLTHNGYPVSQAHINKMEQTITWLLPCIPDLLRRGLGKPSVEKLLALRAAVLRLQEKFSPETDLNPVFSQSLALFNDCEEGLIISHFRDELLGQLSQAMQLDYNLLILEMDEANCRRQQLLGPPPEPPAWHPATPEPLPVHEPETKPKKQPSPPAAHPHTESCTEPVCDIWKIEPLFDHLKALRAMADRLAWDIASASEMENYITPDTDNGVGFRLAPPPVNADSCCYQLLSFLTGDKSLRMPGLSLLLSPEREDEQILKIFRLIRISRRICQLMQQEENR